MPTYSPLLDIMIEILTYENTSLHAIRVVGEVISADASFSDRMADAHGRAGHSTAEKMFDRMKAYEEAIEKARTAWTTFKESVEQKGVLNMEPHEALERSLIEIRQSLDALAHREPPENRSSP